MTRVLKRLLIEYNQKDTTSCVIPIPLENEKVLLQIHDRQGKSQVSNYSYIDKLVAGNGMRYIWNNYRNCLEQIKVTILNEGKYLLKLPEHLILDAAYY